MHSSLMPYMQDLLALVDEDLHVLHMSPALERLLFPHGKPVGQVLLSSLIMTDGMPLQLQEERWQACQFRDESGQLHLMHLQAMPLEDQSARNILRFRKTDQSGQFNQAVQRIYQQSARHVGQSFLDEILVLICRELVVDGAFVAEWEEYAGFRFRARHFPSGINPDLQWLQAHEPDVLDHCLRLDKSHCPDMQASGVDVLKSFPLRTAEGNLLGVLAIVDGDRHSLPEWTEDLLVLLGSRCVSELERMRAQRRMEQLAYFDPLTELPNRQSFREHVDGLLQTGADAQGRNLLFLDMDRFKQVNDTLGHHFGDRLLQLAARRLNRALECGCRAYRISGDEFAIVVEQGCNLQSVLERVVLVFERPYRIDGHYIQTAVSVGVAPWRQEYQDAHDWLRDADHAMYVAKRSPDEQIVYFDDAMRERLRERVRLQQQVDQAWERGEMFLHYQPVYGLRENKLRGFEALLRWQHPEDGLIGPERFIPLCEDSGQILQLDRWVFSRVCKQLGQWKREMGAAALLPINVNASALQVAQPDFSDYYHAQIVRYDLDPELIHLEITETALLDDRGAAAANLEKLRQTGIKIVVDDFGMGYSSLGRLRQLPVDILKIDRSFIQNMLQDEDDMEVVWAIVTLAHNMDKRIVAEGIEDSMQRDLLQTMRCDLGQGYLLGKPVPAEQAAQLMHALLQAVPAQARA